MDEIPFPKKEPVEGVGQLPGTLLHEGRRGMRRDARDLHAPCGQLHHHQDIVRHESVPRRNLHREEVRRREDFPVQLQELRPAHTALPTLRCGFHVMTAQDVPHGNFIDLMPQIRQGPLDAPIAPGRILLGHLDREPLDLLRHGWSPELCAARAPVELLGDEAAVPAEEGLRGSERRDFLQALAPEWVSERSETAAFRIGQTQRAATELGFQDAILLD